MRILSVHQNEMRNLNERNLTVYNKLYSQWCQFQAS